MTWTMNASGHLDSPDAEAHLIAVLRDAVRSGDAHLATISTTHHGQVNLLTDDTTAGTATGASLPVGDTEREPG